MREGEKLKAPRYASAAALCDDYVTTYNIIPNNYKGSQQNYAVKGINILRDNNYIKAIKEYLIKHFTFYYNSIYRVYKDAKYGIR